jgi:protein-S-isoprenylcysteine O-methyltransferase Ste14
MTSLRNAIVGTTVGLAIFVGLPLVGWGLGDVPGFLADGVRLAYVVIAAGTTVAIASLVPPPGRGRGDEEKRVRRQHLAVVLLQVLGLAIVIVAPYGDRRGIGLVSFPGSRATGLALFAAGQAIVSWAQAALDRQFSVEVTIQEGHRLVTGGVYRWIRHPRYLGIVVFTAGFSLVFRSGPALALVGAEAAVLLWRIRDEEALLRREFGDAWDAYARRSWRLLPFVF